VVQAILIDERSELVIPAMPRVDVASPSGPDPRVAIRGTNIPFPVRVIYNQVDTLDVLERCPPVRAIVADDGLELVKRVADVLVARESATRVAVSQKFHHLDLIYVSFE
jgi:hypothetical protein